MLRWVPGVMLGSWMELFLIAMLSPVGLLMRRLKHNPNVAQAI
jgi:hypothetical protein